MNVGRGRPSVPGPASVPLTAPSIASIAAAAPGSTRDGLARILRLGLVMLGLTVFSGVFFVTGEAETTARLSRGAVEGSRLVQTTLGLVFLLALVLIACGHLRELGATLWANRWFTALILLCLASTAWSAAPGVSFRRSIALVGQVLTAYAFTRGLRTMDVVRMVLIFYTVITVAAFITRPFAPELVTMRWDDLDGRYLFRGFFDHKNSYGRALSQAIVLGAAWLLVGSLRALGPWLAVIVCAVALVATWSKTGMVALGILPLTYPILLLCARPGRDAAAPAAGQAGPAWWGGGARGDRWTGAAAGDPGRHDPHWPHCHLGGGHSRRPAVSAARPWLRRLLAR